MKFDIVIDDKLDLLTFRSMFFNLLGKEISTYDLLIDDLIVRVTVRPWSDDNSNLIRVGIFENIISTAPLPQIHPCQDVRFCNLSMIQELFSGLNWYASYDANKAYTAIETLLKTIHKVNKLKAFL